MWDAIVLSACCRRRAVATNAELLGIKVQRGVFGRVWNAAGKLNGSYKYFGDSL